VTDEEAIVQVEWRPLTREIPFDAGTALGSVTVTRADDTQEDRGQLTRVDTAKLAIQIFGGSATRISVGDRIVTWVRTGRGVGPTHGP